MVIIIPVLQCAEKNKEQIQKLQAFYFSFFLANYFFGDNCF